MINLEPRAVAWGRVADAVSLAGIVFMAIYIFLHLATWTYRGFPIAGESVGTYQTNK